MTTATDRVSCICGVDVPGKEWPAHLGGTGRHAEAIEKKHGGPAPSIPPVLITLDKGGILTPIASAGDSPQALLRVGPYVFGANWLHQFLTSLPGAVIALGDGRVLLFGGVDPDAPGTIQFNTIRGPVVAEAFARAASMPGGGRLQ